MLLAFPPGGPTDINARLFAQKLSEQTGQPFVVENRPGAGGNIAAAEAAKAAPDGSTIFYNTSAITIAPALSSSVTFDPVKDFAPVALCAKTAMALSAGPMLPAGITTLAGFLQWARENPKQANYATTSTSAGALPLYGMCCIFNPSCDANSAPERCVMVPEPDEA